MMVHHSVPLLMKLFYSFEHGYKTITHGISFWGKKKGKQKVYSGSHGEKRKIHWDT